MTERLPTNVRHSRLVDRGKKPPKVYEYWLVTLEGNLDALKEWLYEHNIRYDYRYSLDSQHGIWVYSEDDAMTVKLGWVG